MISQASHRHPPVLPRRQHSAVALPGGGVDQSALRNQTQRPIFETPPIVPRVALLSRSVRVLPGSAL
ncbi:hypothetical protein DPMN_070432 [Dreissena polymorpha]|uniref:Uncharacterized protein n=1 Tax=Dreissena polymorpha TaxID=45954 RepID=A0A9D3Z5E7_DREPO|nr:hypothetical protein DPMN_070432 [Dreissena polymorpha]